MYYWNTWLWALVPDELHHSSANTSKSDKYLETQEGNFFKDASVIHNIFVE